MEHPVDKTRLDENRWLPDRIREKFNDGAFRKNVDMVGFLLSMHGGQKFGKLVGRTPDVVLACALTEDVAHCGELAKFFEGEDLRLIRDRICETDRESAWEDLARSRPESEHPELQERWIQRFVVDPKMRLTGYRVASWMNAAKGADPVQLQIATIMNKKNDRSDVVMDTVVHSGRADVTVAVAGFMHVIGQADSSLQYMIRKLPKHRVEAALIAMFECATSGLFSPAESMSAMRALQRSREHHPAGYDYEGQVSKFEDHIVEKWKLSDIQSFVRSFDRKEGRAAGYVAADHVMGQ